MTIDTPLDNSEFLVDTLDPVTGERYRDVRFIAKATDPDGDPLTFAWWDSINGGPYAQVAFTLSPTIRLVSSRCSPSRRRRTTSSSSRPTARTCRRRGSGCGSPP